ETRQGGCIVQGSALPPSRPPPPAPAHHAPQRAPALPRRLHPPPSAERAGRARRGSGAVGHHAGGRGAGVAGGRRGQGARGGPHRRGGTLPAARPQRRHLPPPRRPRGVPLGHRFGRGAGGRGHGGAHPARLRGARAAGGAGGHGRAPPLH
ncbi:MAG: hypothetical protein AVDCRST_MAG68-4487, partial [uncultured Gemmatimonadetes bacterium]